MGQPQTLQPSLSVIIPCYNESHRLGRSLELVRAYAERSNRAVEVIVVDDGSNDGTADLARGFPAAPMVLRVLVSQANRGKGYSVRMGMQQATGEVLLMCDADMSTPIDEVEKLLAQLVAGADVAIGSRDMPDSRLDPPQGPLRRLLNGAFRLVRRSILLPDIRDSQCGFKAFKRQAADHIFARQTADGFAFDCEVLGLARALGCEIREVGVIWRNDPRSTLKVWRDGPRMLLELLRIRRRLRQFSPTSTREP
jgi:dolichyl-phosphate beta-glucosyltransferase